MVLQESLFRHVFQINSIHSVVDFILIAIVLTNIFMLGATRLASFIKIGAIQGFLLGVVTIALHQGDLNLRYVVLASCNIILKGAVFPYILFHAIRVAKIKREVAPLLGYSASLLAGALIFVFSLWLSARLPLPDRKISGLVLPVAFFTIFTGCLLLISRTKAITQVISYIILEGGIYLFGIPFIAEIPFLIEFGLLLDLTVGIFLMGIILQHINRAFDSLNVNYLTNLRDWTD